MGSLVWLIRLEPSAKYLIVFANIILSGQIFICIYNYKAPTNPFFFMPKVYLIITASSFLIILAEFSLLWDLNSNYKTIPSDKTFTAFSLSPNVLAEPGEYEIDLFVPSPLPPQRIGSISILAVADSERISKHKPSIRSSVSDITQESLENSMYIKHLTSSEQSFPITISNQTHRDSSGLLDTRNSNQATKCDHLGPLFMWNGIECLDTTARGRENNVNLFN